MIQATVDRVDDPRLDPFRNLKGQSRRNDDTFVAESEIVLDRLFESGFVIRSILITPARAQRLMEMLSAKTVDHDDSETALFVAPQSVIDEVVGYPLHRGVVAVAERPKLRSPAELLGFARTVVVLENVMDPENVGSVFRHAAGFGVDAVILHGHTGDPLYRKTIRTSMGWTLTIPFARTAVDQMVTTLLFDAGFCTVALTPARSADTIAGVFASFDQSARVALLLGAEGPGLLDSTLASSDYRARIPLADGVDSLNIATAAAIALYALVEAFPERLRQQRAPRGSGLPRN